MHRIVEITEIIGSVCVEGHQIDSIPISEIENVMLKVREENQFVSVRLSRKAMDRALSLAGQTASPKLEKIMIPKDSETHIRFIREYYRLDLDTRSILSKIVKEFIHDGKI